MPLATRTPTNSNIYSVEYFYFSSVSKGAGNKLWSSVLRNSFRDGFVIDCEIKEQYSRVGPSPDPSSLQKSNSVIDYFIYKQNQGFTFLDMKQSMLFTELERILYREIFSFLRVSLVILWKSISYYSCNFYLLLWIIWLRTLLILKKTDL